MQISRRENTVNRSFAPLLVFLVFVLSGTSLLFCREDLLQQRLRFIFEQCAVREITDVCMEKTPEELRGQRFLARSSRKSMIGGQDLVLEFPDIQKKYLVLIYHYGGANYELRHIEELSSGIYKTSHGK